MGKLVCLLIRDELAGVLLRYGCDLLVPQEQCNRTMHTASTSARPRRIGRAWRTATLPRSVQCRSAPGTPEASITESRRNAGLPVSSDRSGPECREMSVRSVKATVRQEFLPEISTERSRRPSADRERPRSISRVSPSICSALGGRVHAHRIGSATPWIVENSGREGEVDRGGGGGTPTGRAARAVARRSSFKELSRLRHGYRDTRR